MSRAIIDTFALKLGLGSLTDKVEERLKKQQEKRQFKDAGIRTGRSRKERAAYGVLLRISDIENIEKDEATAIEIVQKKRVLPPINIDAEVEKGTEPGAAYLKVKLQESFISKPNKNTVEHRAIYIKTAEILRQLFEASISLKQLEDNAPTITYLYEKIIADTYNEEPDRYFSHKAIAKEYYSINFIYTLYAVRGYNSSSKAAAEKYSNAIRYNGLSVEKAKENYEQYKKQIDGYIGLRKENLQKLYKIQTIADLTEYHKKSCPFTGGYLSEYYQKKDIKTYVKYVETVVNRWIAEKEDSLRDDRLPWSCKPHEPDWSWAGIKKQRKSSTKSELKINSGKPLDYIKRTGGLQILEVNENDIINNLGFSGITLGNYVKDDEAKEHIRHFVSAIADLCEVLDLNQHVINKGLSIGFGAYGRGGVAMATYYPTLQVINLTKRSGDGCVCHEWGHFLDNYLFDFNNNGMFLSKWARNKLYDDYYIDRYENAKSRRRLYTDNLVEVIRKIINSEVGVKKEMLRLMGYAIFGLKINEDGTSVNHSNVTMTHRSKFYTESNKQKSNYWVDPVEMFARSFETYVYDKLQIRNRENNYLVSGGYFHHGVYPQAEERSVLYDLHNGLVSAIKTAYHINGFKAWTDVRNDEYIVIDEKSKTGDVKTGVIVTNDKEKRIRIAKAKAAAKKKLLMLINN